MTRIIETRNNIFKFYDNHRSPQEINEESSYLEVKITVTEKEYDDNKRFYYIDYEYKLIVKSDMCEAKRVNIFQRIFPFNNDDYDSNEGVPVNLIEPGLGFFPIENSRFPTAILPSFTFSGNTPSFG
jgi:hypothetical protein